MPPVRDRTNGTTEADDRSVFVNCPFDEPYRPMLEAIVFTIADCGYIPRSALEIVDSGETRIAKLFRLIGACRIGVHDISRVELDANHGLPRFNMPLELGIFLGAKAYGAGRQKAKTCLILERERFQAQKYCSDLAGHDFQAHGDDVGEAVEIVRNCLHNDRLRRTSADGLSPKLLSPSGRSIAARFARFRRGLDGICRRRRIVRDRFVFNQFAEFTSHASDWIELNPWTPG